MINLNLVEQQEPTIDPVCGMKVDPSHAAGSFLHAKTTYFFCSQHCLVRFRSDPDRFLKADAVVGGTNDTHSCCQLPTMPNTAMVGSGSTEYYCPMDPEIVQDHPGSCSVCGMALEPRSVQLGVVNPEQVQMTRRFALGLLCTVPIVLLAMSDLLPLPFGQTWVVTHPRTVNWIELFLSLPVIFWSGWPFLERAARSIQTRNLNMFTLIALGVGAAFSYSLCATVFPDWFPSDQRSMHGSIPTYFETATVITVLILLGQIFEIRARQRTTSAIRALMSLFPDSVRLIDATGEEKDVPLSQVSVGSLLRVRPGERIAVDGLVMEGQGTVDESMLTGESVPVEKSNGANLIAGSINLSGGLIMKATRIGQDTLLSRIIQYVSQAQTARAPIEKLVNRVSAIFVPFVLFSATVCFFYWAFWAAEPHFATGLINAVSVLIIACPCALGLATPMAVIVGMGRAATAGVLFRDAESMELLHQTDILFIDKTGTITEGKPRVTGLIAYDHFVENDLLSWSASLEQVSEHPFAKAIVNAAKERQLLLHKPDQYRMIPAQGIIGTVAGHQIIIGTPEFLNSQHVPFDPVHEKLDNFRRQGQTAIMIAVDQRTAGIVLLADQPKAVSSQAIQQLKEIGFRVIMLSGDNPITAQAIAALVGIDELRAGVSPEEKAKVVQSFQEQGHKVIMAGDGINDAPALAQADVGIAMGTGTDIAMFSARITLVKGDLLAIIRAWKISKSTHTVIRRNLLLAFLYNGLCIPVAAAGWINPMWASAAMSLSSLSVILNSLTVRWQK